MISTPSSTGATTAVVVASGPSLTDEQIALVEHSDVLTIAVNNSYEKLQHPDAVYACDYLWWKFNHMKVKQNIPRSRLWTQDRAAASSFSCPTSSGKARTAWASAACA